MSDYGECEANLDALEKMMPLSDREKRIARMQFSYKTTMEFTDGYENHPAMKHIMEGGISWKD